MGKYNGAVITTAGQNLIAQAIAESKTVTFTTVQASSHVYPSSTDFEALAALTDVEKTVDINYAGVYSDTVVQVSARFDNDGVDTAYLINTLGFFAQLDTDTPILFAVSTAVTPDQMPVFDADNPSAFIYNMQLTVQNADSINLSVNPAGAVTVEQLNAAVSTINAKIGDLSDLTTDDKSSVVNGINEVDANADTAQSTANSASTKADNAQQMIAPIQSNLTASKAYVVGEQFVYNGLLYKATAAIAQGGTITIGGNCALADSVTEQIYQNKNAINNKLNITTRVRSMADGRAGVAWTPSFEDAIVEAEFGLNSNIHVLFPINKAMTSTTKQFIVGCYLNTSDNHVVKIECSPGGVNLINWYYNGNDISGTNLCKLTVYERG